MSNTLLVLDILNASLQAAARMQEMLTRASVEGRDITDAELATLKADNDTIEKQIIDS